MSRLRAALTRDESGASLVEMMVALFVLGVSMTALAGVLIVNVRAVSDSQGQQAATSAALQVVEELQAMPWAYVALYDAEVAAASSSDWGSRLTEGLFDGSDLITVPGPASAGARDDLYPAPTRSVERDGVTYAVDLYPLWVDRSGDGVADTKRFVTVASWMDPIRGLTEVRTESERAPSQAETTSTGAGARFLQTYISPSPVLAGADGTISQDLIVWARTNVPAEAFLTAAATFESPVLDAAGEVVDTEEHTVTWQVTGSAFTSYVDDTGTTRSGYQTYTTTTDLFGPYRYFNGPIVVTLEVGSDWGAVRGSTSFTVTGSPYDPAGPEAAAPDPTVSASPSEAAVAYTGPPQISLVSISDVCVHQANHRLTAPIRLDLTLSNINVTDGTADAVVTVSFIYNTNKSGTQPASGSVSGSYTYGVAANQQWLAAVPNAGSFRFLPGTTVEFTVTVVRSSDGGNVTDNFTSAPVVAGC